jgi:hypothetical protein
MIAEHPPRAPINDAGFASPRQSIPACNALKAAWNLLAAPSFRIAFWIW